MAESLEFLQFMETAEEEEAWLSEKEAMVGRGDSGDTLAATKVSRVVFFFLWELSFQGHGSRHEF